MVINYYGSAVLMHWTILMNQTVVCDAGFWCLIKEMGATFIRVDKNIDILNRFQNKLTKTTI